MLLLEYEDATISESPFAPSFILEIMTIADECVKISVAYQVSESGTCYAFSSMGRATEIKEISFLPSDGLSAGNIFRLIRNGMVNVNIFVKGLPSQKHRFAPIPYQGISFELGAGGRDIFSKILIKNLETESILLYEGARGTITIKNVWLFHDVVLAERQLLQSRFPAKKSA